MASLRGEFLECLSTAEDFIFANVDSFLFEFVDDDLFELTNVSFSEYGVKIFYVTPDGQHVTDMIEAYRYNDWVERVRESQLNSGV